MRSYRTITALVFSLSLPLSAFAQKPEPMKPGAAERVAARQVDEAAVRAIDDSFREAFKNGDAGALMALYDEDAVVMDPGPSMQMAGREAIRKSFEEMFANTEMVEFELSDRRVTVRGDVAWSLSLWALSAKDKASGQIQKMAGRSSEVLEKKDGKWLIVADHASIPLTVPEAK